MPGFRFLVKTLGRLSTCARLMHILLVYERSWYATTVKIMHGLATLNSNNFIFYGQKHKVWVLVFLVRTSGTFFRLKLNRFGKIFCFATKPLHLQQFQGTLLSISSNGLGNKTVISLVPWTT